MNWELVYSTDDVFAVFLGNIPGCGGLNICVHKLKQIHKSRQILQDYDPF